MEKRQGLKIAYWNKFIVKDELISLAGNLGKGDYVLYLLKLVKGF